MPPKTLQTVELASDDQPLTKWQKRDKEKMRAYRRKSYAKHREKNLARSRRWRAENQDRLREYSDVYKDRAHEAFRLQFDTERERERLDHLQIKATRLRKAILRSGEIPDHDAWTCDMEALVGYVAAHVQAVEHYDRWQSLI